MKKRAPKKFVIIGSTLSGNKGAAAMLESAIETLSQEFPDSHFTLLTYLPEGEDEHLNTYKNLTILKATPLYLGVVIQGLAVLYKLLPFLRRSIARRNEQIAAIEAADVVLDQAGISFVDGREKFLLYNVASISPAILLGKKIVKCAQALGPFKGRINRLVAKTILPRITAIVARGEITYQNLQSLQLRNIEKGVDYSFLLKITNKEERAAKEYYDEQFFHAKKIVGVAPSVVLQKKLGEEYTNTITTFINWLIEQQYRVVLLPHSVRAQTEKLHNNDLPLCREIYQSVTKKEECLFINDELRSQELRAVIGRCDLFVASRFHAMVSSLAMQVPTLVIGWSHKYQEVLSMFEQQQWAFSYNQLSGALLQEKFLLLEKNEKDIRAQLKKHLPEVTKMAQKQVETIAALAAG
jgi:colanic acid/amylovoran biosynthesis protein